VIKGTLTVWLLLVLNLSAAAQEYLWPTDASPYMTSAFGESRPRRFHAAMDVKTWNQTGYRVFAVRSGYLERMAISPFGYGRVLYLRLDTGEVTVYAHLERFNERLQTIAEQEQERAGRYRIDKYFSPGAVPIKKGEVIGYTGQTGIGVPHLHFELRDARNRPLNPFLRGFKVADTIPPVITALAITPLVPGAMVNDDFAPVVLRPFRQIGKWRIPGTIHISGKAGVAIDAYDQANGVENRFGVYRLQLFVDDSLQFQTQYDRFDYSQNKLIELDREYLLDRRNLGDFHRLYRIAGNALGFYSHLNHSDGALMCWPDQAEATSVPNNGVDELAVDSRQYQALHALSWGERRLRVIVSDFFGNQAVLEADLMVGPRFVLTPQIFDRQPSRVLISAIQFSPTRRIQKLEAAAATANDRTILSSWRPLSVRWKPADSPVQQTDALEISAVADSLQNNGAGPLLPPDSLLVLQTGGASLIRLVAVDQYGLRSHPAYILNPPARKSATPLLINVEKDFYPNYLRLLIRANQPLAGAPAIKFSTGRKEYHAESLPQQPNRYIASVPLAEIAGDSVRLEVTADNLFGQSEMWQEWFENALVQPGRSRSLFAADARMRVVFSDEAVYVPMYGRVSIDSLTRLQDARVIGPIYRVEPQDVALSEGAMVTLSYPDTISQPRQIGVCYRDRDEWVFIENIPNFSNHTVSARVFSLEDFAIMRDSEPPSLSVRSPRPGAILQNRHPLITVDVKDSTSGFESERSIELRLDGRLLIAEYDPERDVVHYQPRSALVPGVHKLTARAEDRCGNVARREVEFQVR
jgi:hypothetical protein